MNLVSSTKFMSMRDCSVANVEMIAITMLVTPDLSGEVSQADAQRWKLRRKS